jgi:transcription antitermination protein NusB
MGLRRKSREYALQMMFQWDITHDGIDSIAETFWETLEVPEPGEVVAFANALATGTIEQIEKIDAIVGRHADNWRLDRMAVVDRNLLRMATYEFLHGVEKEEEMPAAVIINEAIEIARRFSAEGSPQFINGILDSIRKEIEK